MNKTHDYFSYLYLIYKIRKDTKLDFNKVFIIPFEHLTLNSVIHLLHFRFFCKDKDEKESIKKCICY